MINAVLNINKPKGVTSHDVVAEVRRIIGEKKVGHTGTLDPNATGVLLLCLGRATKLSQEFTGKKKTYTARMRLGIRTDTQDGEGKIIAESVPTGIDENCLKEVLSAFTGEIEQIPPMYSAVKINGKRLYQLARKGITVDRPAKRVHIYKLEYRKLDGNYFDFEAETSSGVYIRTLCDEIGERLGCGGHLAELKRTKVGDYSISDAISLNELRRIVQEGKLETKLIPVSNWPTIEYNKTKLQRKIVNA